MNDPNVIYIASVDENRFNSAEWFSRVRFTLNQSLSIRQSYRWVCWDFNSLPEALSAIRKNPDKEFICIRIDPTERIMQSYVGNAQVYLERAFQPLKRRNCIVIFEPNHESINGVQGVTSRFRKETPQESPPDLIKKALELRSNGRSRILSSRIDDISAFGVEGLKDVKQHINRLITRCDRAEERIDELTKSVLGHENELKQIRTWWQQVRSLMANLTRQAIIRSLGLLGLGAGAFKLVEILFSL